MPAPMAPAPMTTMSAARGGAGLTAGSVESLAQAIFHVALVLLHAAGGGRLEVDLVPEDLGHRGQSGHVGPALAIPEARALEGLGAVEEALLDLDPDGDLGPLALRLEPGQDLRVADHARAPVDAQGVLAAGDEEDHPNVRVVHDVEVAVDAIVAEPVRDHQVRVVEHQHETGAVALGRDVAASLAARGGQQDERRAGDELPGCLLYTSP